MADKNVYVVVRKEPSSRIMEGLLLFWSKIGGWTIDLEQAVVLSYEQAKALAPGVGGDVCLREQIEGKAVEHAGATVATKDMVIPS